MQIVSSVSELGRAPARAIFPRERTRSFSLFLSRARDSLPPFVTFIIIENLVYTRAKLPREFGDEGGRDTDLSFAIYFRRIKLAGTELSNNLRSCPIKYASRR